MDVDKLEKILQEMTGEKNVKKYLRVIAHWTKTISKQGEMMTADPKDMLTLSKLQDMGIFDVKFEDGTAVVKLTEEGKNLSKDFFMKAYYVEG